MNKINAVDFINKLHPIYKAIKKVKNNEIIKDKDLIGFVGAPWTLLVYMINKSSPKKNNITDLNKNFFKDSSKINKILKLLEEYLKIHIKHQIKNGATIIQIFDSWAGLLKEQDLQNFIYIPTLNLVNFVKSLNIPVICFPRGIKNYNEYCKIVKPDVISIDYEINPDEIRKNTDITIQGGFDPKILLTDQEKIKLEAKKYLESFKDHPYIFNLGHGILPETDPNMVDYLIKFVKDFK